VAPQRDCLTRRLSRRKKPVETDSAKRPPILHDASTSSKCTDLGCRSTQRSLSTGDDTLVSGFSRHQTPNPSAAHWTPPPTTRDSGAEWSGARGPILTKVRFPLVMGPSIATARSRFYDDRAPGGDPGSPRTAYGSHHLPVPRTTRCHDRLADHPRGQGIRGQNRTKQNAYEHGTTNVLIAMRPTEQSRRLISPPARLEREPPADGKRAGGHGSQKITPGTSLGPDRPVRKTSVLQSVAVV